MMQQMLLGGGGISATLPATLQVWDTKISPASATASFTLNAAGTYTSVGSTASVSGTWAIGGGAADYQFRLTPTGGAFSGASTGIWVGPSASPTWSLTLSGIGTDSAVGTLEIRNNATTQVLATSELTLNVDVFANA